MGHFSSLLVWEKARALSNGVEELLGEASDRVGDSLRDQMSRAADSVVFNIAESSGRDGIRDQIRILVIARGSAHELESQLYAVADRDSSCANRVERLLNEVTAVRQLINGLIKHKRGRLGD